MMKEQVMNGWMNSDGHRANILNKNFTSMGVGYYQDENGGPFRLLCLRCVI